MARVLIVTAGPLCRNPRVLKEAQALGTGGYDVTVLTVANHERFEAYDREIMESAPFRKVAVDRASRTPFVRVLDFMERGFARAARGALRFGLESRLSLGSSLALKRRALRIPADLTILHTEIPFGFGQSLIEQGCRVAADFEDWHSRDLLPAARATRPIRLLDRTERYLVREAAYTSAPSESMAEALKSAYGGRSPIVIPNAFPLQPQPSALPRQTPPAFFWFSQTIGEGRGLEPFLAAWGMSKAPSSVYLLGDVSISYKERLMSLVPSDRRESLRFLPITSPDHLPSLIANHDIGLALEPMSPESRFLTTTNKIFQYLNAGLAIVATPTAGQREVLAKAPEAGILVDLGDIAGLAATLDNMVRDPARLAAMGIASRRAAAQQFSWEHCAPRLLAAVASVLRQ